VSDNEEEKFHLCTLFTAVLGCKEAKSKKCEGFLEVDFA
jgi:hypothetical protein